MFKMKNTKLVIKKNKRGSSRAEPNRLSTNYIYYNRQKYLNVSIDKNNSCAGMAERLTQLVVNQYPSGCVGSIPTASATLF